MDGRGDDDISLLAKVALRLIAAVSFLSVLYSCFSGYTTLVFSLFAHSLDRKYVFLICNAILAFLINTFTFSSSSSSSSIIKSAQDSEETLVQQNAAAASSSSSVEYAFSTRAVDEEMEKQHEETKVEDEDEDRVVEENIGEAEEISFDVKVEDQSNYVEEEEEENKEEEKEVANDASVSTEELNHKIEEFIRKMKEEIRIEALHQQHLVPA